MGIISPGVLKFHTSPNICFKIVVKQRKFDVREGCKIQLYDSNTSLDIADFGGKK